jgi:hypothetical protein
MMLLDAWTSTVAPHVGGRHDEQVGCVGIKYDRTKVDFIDDIAVMEEIMAFAIRKSSPPAARPGKKAASK